MIDDPRYFVITRTPFVSLSSFLTSITAAQLIASAVLGRSCVWRLELVEAPLQHEGPPPDHPRLTNILIISILLLLYLGYHTATVHSYCQPQELNHRATITHT